MPKSDKNNLILAPDFFKSLKLKHLLLDTCFFIDFSKNRSVFIDFLKRCDENQVTLTTISPVVVEFTKGSETQTILAAKLALVEQLVQGYYLPIHPDVHNIHIPLLIEKYGKAGKGTSLTDFMLGGMIVHHKSDLCLLTKNSTDFPLNVFSLKTHFILCKERALQTYGVYCYEK